MIEDCLDTPWGARRMRYVYGVPRRISLGFAHSTTAAGIWRRRSVRSVDLKQTVCSDERKEDDTVNGSDEHKKDAANGSDQDEIFDDLADADGEGFKLWIGSVIKDWNAERLVAKKELRKSKRSSKKGAPETTDGATSAAKKFPSNLYTDNIFNVATFIDKDKTLPDKAHYQEYEDGFNPKKAKADLSDLKALYRLYLGQQSEPEEVLEQE